jgi:hypothetical protein
MTERPLRSHTHMPAQTWWTPYHIKTWDGTYDRYYGLEYAPTYNRLYGDIDPKQLYRPKAAPIHVPLELVAA